MYASSRMTWAFVELHIFFIAAYLRALGMGDHYFCEIVILSSAFPQLIYVPWGLLGG